MYGSNTLEGFNILEGSNTLEDSNNLDGSNIIEGSNILLDFKDWDSFQNIQAKGEIKRYIKEI